MESCASICDNNEECGFYTYFESISACMISASCPETINNPNLPAITNEKGCPTNVCFVTGSQCFGNTISISITADVYECYDICVDDLSCQWFEFDSDSNLCFLLADCTSYNSDCATCTIGNRNCSPKEEQVLLLGLGGDSSKAKR